MSDDRHSKRAATMRWNKEMAAMIQAAFKPNSKKQLLHEAQTLIYDAWEASTRKRVVRLAHRALDISHDCADAYVLLAEAEAKTFVEAIDLYRKGVKAGERALGKKCFRENEGHFWGMLDTRPYMRAMNGLASTLRSVGENDEALGIWREMLRLNPNDNQGVRYQLLAALLELQLDKEAARLLKLYEGDIMADWTYGAALLAFRQKGDTATARKKLKKALACNPHIPAYLLGRKKIPKRLPDHISPGDATEAISYADGCRAGWSKTVGALEWLATQLA